MDYIGVRSAYGHALDDVSRQGYAWNDGTVDVRAQSHLPPLQAITLASLSRVLRVVWDLSTEYGFRTWKFDVFEIKNRREILVGTVALHYDP